MEKDFVKTFTKCPCCGGADRFFGTMLKELKEQGHVPEHSTSFDFQEYSGVLLPPQKIATLPLGAELPAFKVVWDFCTDCGCMYMVIVHRPKAVKSLDVPKLIVPGSIDPAGASKISPNRFSKS